MPGNQTSRSEDVRRTVQQGTAQTDALHLSALVLVLVGTHCQRDQLDSLDFGEGINRWDIATLMKLAEVFTHP